jgi:hypothetical protein
MGFGASKHGRGGRQSYRTFQNTTQTTGIGQRNSLGNGKVMLIFTKSLVEGYKTQFIFANVKSQAFDALIDAGVNHSCYGKASARKRKSFRYSVTAPPHQVTSRDLKREGGWKT